MPNKNPSPKELIAEIKMHGSQKNYDAMLASAQNAVRAYPEEKKMWKLLHDAQAKYVNEKLESSVVKQLEDKEDYVTLAAIYQKLLAVFPDSAELQKLLKAVRNKVRQAEQKTKKVFYDNAQKTIEDLMAKNELEDALQACYEVLSSDPENKTFIKLLVRIQTRIDAQIERDLQVYFKKSKPVLKSEYKANKNQFIRI